MFRWSYIAGVPCQGFNLSIEKDILIINETFLFKEFIRIA